MIVWYCCKDMAKSHAGESNSQVSKPKTQGLGKPCINDKMVHCSLWCLNKITAV